MQTGVQAGEGHALGRWALTVPIRAGQEQRQSREVQVTHRKWRGSCLAESGHRKGAAIGGAGGAARLWPPCPGQPSGLQVPLWALPFITNLS